MEPYLGPDQEIIDEDVERILELTDYFPLQPQRVLGLDEHTLDELTEGIFQNSPKLKQKASPSDRAMLKGSILMAIEHLGRKRRKIGNRYFFSHPYRTAIILAETYEQEIQEEDQARQTKSKEKATRRPRRVSSTTVKLHRTVIPALAAALHHDTIEEKIEEEIKKVSGQLRRRILQDSYSEREQNAYDFFSELGKRFRGISVPSYMEHYDDYCKAYRAMFSGQKGERIARKMKESSFTISEKEDYLTILKVIIERMEKKVRLLEKLMISQMRNWFDDLLMLYLSTPEGEAEQDEKVVSNAQKISRLVGELTRVGSDTYYQSLIKACSDQEALEIKLADRIANSLELDIRERAAGSTYFKFCPRAKTEKRTLNDHLDSFRENKGCLRKLIDQGKINLMTILNTEQIEDDEDGSNQESNQELREMINGIYQVIAMNNQNRKITGAMERKESIKMKLATHERLYQLYKNMILITYVRKRYDTRAMPTTIRHLEQRLLQITLEDANRIIEGTFSNHCLGGKFTFAEARQIYLEVGEYEQRGGFDKVTKEPEQSGPKTEFSLDGLLSRYFDQRIKGIKTATYPLFQNKKLLFATTLSLHRLAEKYQAESGFYIKGISIEGLKPKRAVGRE
jgi:hypothetical protein